MLKIVILIFKFKYILYVLFFIYSVDSYSSGIDIFTPKKQTPSGIIINTLSKPDIFSTSNDLTRLVGSFNVAVGELLYFKGTITDAFGIPIEGANIKIWHTNSSGMYHSLLKPKSRFIDKNFVMSGTAKSDNLGRYGFKTIFPGFERGRAPIINIIITHPQFGEIQTEAYFEKHPLNGEDPFYKSYIEEDKKLLTAIIKNIDDVEPKEGKVATFNIVMDGVHSYKGY